MRAKRSNLQQIVSSASPPRNDKGWLLIFGLGYVGAMLAVAARSDGFIVDGADRSTDARDNIATATHLLSTAPPDEIGDPVLARYRTAIASAPRLRWIGYLSTTGVYGDRQGGWVDETTEPAPGSERSRRRLAVEESWRQTAGGRPVDLFRLSGIYGPGRSAFDDLRAGTARRVIKPGHAFGRIHRDDIVRAVLAAMQQERLPGVRVLNVTDDEPAESAVVIEEAVRLLGVAPPAAVSFADAVTSMSAMARSFWAENRKVANRRTKQTLGLEWLYPTYREGLRAILAEERSHRLA